MKHVAIIFCSLVACACSALAAAPDFSLAGQWRFQLDRADAGVNERWFAARLHDTIQLPGTLAGQGIGDDITTNTAWTGGIVDKSWFTAPEYAKYREPGNVKVPFWLQPQKYYAGAAWYQRDIEVPADWAGRRVVLFLERAHWETRVWIDDQLIGTNSSLSTPHEYDLGQLAPGKHTVTLRVDNRRIVDIGENSHGISDHTQGNWNGIVGKIELRSTPLVWIEELQVYPNWDSGSVKVSGRINTLDENPDSMHIAVKNVPADQWRTTLAGGEEQKAKFILATTGFIDGSLPIKWTTNHGVFHGEVKFIGRASGWSEFEQPLCRLIVGVAALPSGKQQIGDTKLVEVGFRSIRTNGTQFTLNSNVVFFRGTLECAIFPKTGHPPMEVEEWRRIIRVAKAHGLNLLRFHSWCPPEAAFRVADELGMYFQIETCWPNQSTSLGDGKPVDQWVYEETDRILNYYGNHPSFVLMAHGNEPGGRNANAWLAKYVTHYRALDPRRLWTSGAGWPQLPENQFHVSPDPRVQAWGAGLKSRINAQPPETTTDYRNYVARRGVPVISHEIGQWCVYPNFDEIPKYTGYLRPRNFEIFRDRLAANGLGGLAREFLLASGKLQTLCYKEDIESALRTPGMGGFQLLDLHDFPGQGTALVGVLDPFWEEKGYVNAKEYNRFCSAIVPLARLPKRVFTTSETLEAAIEVANYSREIKRQAVVTWKLMGTDSQLLSGGRLPRQDLASGGLASCDKISIPLQSLRAPAHGRLVVGIAGTAIENDWDVWVYPKATTLEPQGILVTSQFDAAAQHYLQDGGKLLLTIPGAQVRNFDTAPVKLGFSSIFWNTAWTGRQAPTTLGILCDPRHPALADFPTDFHSNWQWWYLLHRAGALRLDLLPTEVKPIVRVIDDWVTARPLGLVVEGKVGAGKIVICGFDLMQGADDPVSRQMRASLIRYLNSERCEPSVELAVAQIQSLIAAKPAGSLHGIKSIGADSEQEGHEAALATDGDPATMWHTTWGALAAGFPHELMVEFVAPRSLAGVKLLPRQDGNRNGWIKDCELYVSTDGREWGQPVARTKLPAGANEHEIKFAQPVTTHFLKLRASSGHSDGPWSSLAELKFLPAAN